MTPIKLDKAKPGRVVDALYALRTERLQLQGVVEDMKAEEQRVKDWLIDTLPKADLTKLAGKQASASLTRTTQADIKDWKKLFGYCQKTGDFDLLQKRVSIEAVRERWDNGVELPGVERFTRLDLSLTKLGGKANA
jgi:hypothetical protein